MEYFISFAVIVMETFCSFQAFSTLLKPKSRKKELIAGAALALTSFSVINFLHVQEPVKSVYIVAAFFIAMLYAYEGTAVAKLFTAVMTYVLILLVNYMMAYLLMFITGDDFDGIRQDPLFFVFGALITEVAIFMVVVFIRRVLVKRRDENGIKTIQWLGMLLFPTVSLFTIYLLMISTISSGDTSFTNIIAAVGLMFANIALYYIIDSLGTGFKAEQENQALKIQAYNETKKTQALEEVFTEHRRQTHEFKNHLTALQGLLESGDTGSALEYVEGIKGDIYLGDAVINTGNAAVDKVINQYYHLAKAQGVTMDFVMGGKISIPIPVEEFIIVISNVLDNAVKASKESASRSVTVKLIEDNGLLYAVRNSVDKDIVIENNQVISDSQDIEHGYGLKNVALIMEKYGYYYAIECADGWFVFSAIFNSFTI